MENNKQNIRISLIDAMLGGYKLYEASRTYHNTNRIRVRERTIYSGFPNHVYSSPFSGRALFKWRDHDYRANIPYAYSTDNYDQKSLTFAQANALLDLHWERRHLPDELGKSQKPRRYAYAKYGKP